MNMEKPGYKPRSCKYLPKYCHLVWLLFSGVVVIFLSLIIYASQVKAEETNNWLDPLVDTIRFKNVGEFTFNQTFYTLKNDQPWLVDGISASEIDINRTQSRTLNRWISRTNSWWNRYSATVNETYIPLSANDPPLIISLQDVHPSLYSLYIYGTINENGRTELPRVWKPLPVVFKLFDSQDNLLEQATRLAKQGISSHDLISSPRVMQQFSFHIPSHGDYRVAISIHHTGQEVAEIMFIKPVDELEGIPDKNIKTSQNYVTYNLPPQVMATNERLDRDQQI